LARGVEKRLQAYNKDHTFPLEKIKEFLDSFDIKFANLESAITRGDIPKKAVKDCKTSTSKCCGLRCHFKTSHRVLDGIVQYAGFNVLSIENNHIEDFETGRIDTQVNLNQFNVSWVDATHPVKINNFKGCKVDFFSYDITFSKATYLMKTVHMVSQLRDSAPDSFKVVSVHGGREYKVYFDDMQKNFAEAAIDAGADMVVYSHAHVTQPFEMYKGKYIFYGLGNFVFDQQFSQRVKEFLMVTFDLENCKDVTNLELWNGEINHHFQPELTSLNVTSR